MKSEIIGRLVLFELKHMLFIISGVVPGSLSQNWSAEPIIFERKYTKAIFFKICSCLKPITVVHNISEWIICLSLVICSIQLA